MPKRRGRPSAAQTPAPKKDVIYGSKKNPKGSAASEKSASKIKLSEKTIESLEKKLKDFKKKHPSKKNVNLGDLKAVYRRGSGAYSKTHRPTITGGAPNTRAAWSFARVNKFLKKAAGESVKKAYVQDDDLLKYEDGGLIAPNGKPSNLTPEQYKLVRTPAFKAWFGDWENEPENASKVVDENGEPLVVYHGSNKKFTEFKNPYGWNYFYFAKNEKYAEFFYESGGSLKKFFLNIRKPFDAKKFGLKKLNPINFTAKIGQSTQYIDYNSSIKNFKIEFWELLRYDDELFNIFKSKGNDGVVFFEENRKYTKDGKLLFDYGESLAFAAFEPNQIKLADGSNTIFDAANPDIRYEDGGEIWYHKYNDAIGYRVNSHNKYGDGIYFSNQKDSRFEGENELECKINYKNPIIFEGKGLPNLEFHKAKGKKTINQFADELFEKYDAIIIKHGGKFGDEIIIRDENLIEPIKYAKGGKTFNDKELLAKWKRGESIGFTGIAHLKAKGLIPRADGIKRKSEKYMEHGGQTGQEIICVNCGWSWNTNDSDESDKYICHKCGFDNTLYYPSMIALPDTYASENRLKEVLETQGYILNKKNMENKDLLEEGGVVVGKRHSEMDENGETGERFIVESTGQLVEVEGGEGVLCKESMNSDKKYVFEGRKMTGKEIASFLNHKYGGVEFAKGGEVKYVCGCKSKYYHGGELPSSTLDSLKGGEAVVTVKTMESEDKYKFGNKTMTPRQILSKINAEHGGKKFDEGGTIDLSNMDYEVDKNMCKMVFFTEKILYL